MELNYKTIELNFKSNSILVFIIILIIIIIIIIMICSVAISGAFGASHHAPEGGPAPGGGLAFGEPQGGAWATDCAVASAPR